MASYTLAHQDDAQTRTNNAVFIRGAMQAPLLERDHEFELARAWREQGDEKALHHLIKAYARLVVAIATRFRHYGLPMGDLIQEGHIGLLQAANRFDTQRELRFSTYATWWVRAAIQDYVLRNWSIVRTGTTASQKSLFFNLRRLRNRIDGKAANKGILAGGLDQVYLSQNTSQEIAKTLQVPLKEVERMDQRLAAGDRSLNAVIHADGQDNWQDFLADPAPDPEATVMQARDTATRHRWIDAALAKLDARERQIIQARHLSDQNATLEALGETLGISKERVRQIETRALARLKTLLEAQAGEPADLLGAA